MGCFLLERFGINKVCHLKTGLSIPLGEITMKMLADSLRNGLILFIWGYVAYLLWNIWWVWAILWVIPGYILLLNLVGFATLPVYLLIGINSPAYKWLKQLHKEQDDERPPES